MLLQKIKNDLAKVLAELSLGCVSPPVLIFFWGGETYIYKQVDLKCLHILCAG
jgi:hypothetical protein